MYSFSFFSALSLLAAIVYLLLGVFILAKNSKEKANRIFFFMSLTLFLWGLGEEMQHASLSVKNAYFWTIVFAAVGATLQPPILLHFWLELSGDIGKFKKKFPIFIIYIPAILFLSLSFFYPYIYTYPHSVLEMQVLEPWGYVTNGNWFYEVYVSYIVLYVTLVVFLAFKKTFQSQGVLRKQSRNIAWGLAFVLCIGTIGHIARAIFNIQIPELAVSSTLIFISAVAYSINKHGLLVITAKVAADNIISTMNDFVLVVDREGKIALVNNSLLNFSGYLQDELLGLPATNILLAENDFSNYDEVIGIVPLSNYNMKVISKNGDKIPVLANITNLKEDNKGESYGLVFVFRDMREIGTLINNLELKTKELKNKNKDLERFNKLIVDREMKMIELKNKIALLESKK